MSVGCVKVVSGSTVIQPPPHHVLLQSEVGLLLVGR